MNVENPILSSYPTVNPYRIALSQIISRMRWDLNPESWMSRRIMKSYHNRYSGGKCVILCNGPSLLKTDFDRLLASDVKIIGLNKINLLFDKTELRPDFIACVNDLVGEQNADFFNETEIPLFLDRMAARYVSKRRNVCFMHSAPQAKLARDMSMSIVKGATVTFVALELAFHMGFEKVALVGCDHSFATKGIPNVTQKSESEDPNHFDPRYFSKVSWQLPDLPASEYFYSIAERTYATFGRTIVNSTVGGNLDIFPRQSLEAFLD